ncbi:unnamed protein product [Cuscuta europaea]|uniref:Uncharacterized protein n=1 Tax=Cuscuta europaea TaxID=41803 RepID=A0A9P0ZCH5_CUSEU|nr:unnamed protein product [Cuscuta europaea]
MESKYNQLEASFADAGRQAIEAFKASREFSELIASRTEDAGKQAVETFKVSQEFSELVASRTAAPRAKQIQAWLQTKEGRDWREEQDLFSFRCGRYDMQKMLYESLTERLPGFEPEKLGLPALPPDPDEEDMAGDDDGHTHWSLQTFPGVPYDLEDVTHGFDFETILQGIPEEPLNP